MRHPGARCDKRTWATTKPRSKRATCTMRPRDSSEFFCRQRGQRQARASLDRDAGRPKPKIIITYIYQCVNSDFGLDAAHLFRRRIERIVAPEVLSLTNFGGSRTLERAATRERPPPARIWRSNRGQIPARAPPRFIQLRPGSCVEISARAPAQQQAIGGLGLGRAAERSLR